MGQRGDVALRFRGADSRGMTRAVALGLATIATLVFAPGLQAQQGGGGTGSSAATPGAISWSVGGGSGSTEVDCDICPDGSDSGLALHVGVRATAHEKFDVGLEVGRWSGEDSKSSTRIDARTVFRPLSGLGFNVIGGAGWIGYSAGEIDFSALTVSVGAGWDVPVTNRWRVGARVLTDLASYGTVVTTGQTGSSTVVDISVDRLEVVLTRR